MGVGDTVLRLHGQILDWMGSDAAKRYFQTFTDSELKKYDFSSMQHDAEHFALKQATLFYVSQNMSELAMHAGAKMPDQHLLASDCPVRTGFMLLEKSWYRPDINGRVLGIKAALWSSVEQLAKEGDFEGGALDVPLEEATHTKVTFYSDIEDPVDEYSQEWREDVNLLRRSGLPRLTPVFSSVIRFGLDLQQVQDPFTKEALRALMATWSLMQQQVAVTSDGEVRKATAKRMKKKKSELRYKLVTLRRRSGGNGQGDGGKEWSCRWHVRGHWRQQHYKSLGPARLPDGSMNPKSHRVIWINEQVRGPDDKPVKSVPTIYQLNR